MRLFLFPLKGARWIYRVSPVSLQVLLHKFQPLSGILLALTFVISFSLPVFIGYQLVVYFTTRDPLSDIAEDRLPDAIRIAHQGVYGTISNDSRLTPSSKEPYLLSGWFRLTQLPEPGERVILVAKFNPSSLMHEGMAVGISRDAVGYRPIVYWRSPNGSGGWYQFAKIPIRPRVWFQLAVSFREGSLLGMHGVADIEDLERGVDLLGGYELDAETYPDADADMVIGAYGQNSFRGFIGPMAIFSGADVGKDIHGVVKRLMRTPGALPDMISKESVIVRGYVGDKLEVASGITSTIVRVGKKRRGVDSQNDEEE